MSSEEAPQRWRSRPVLGAAVRAFAFGVPIVAAVLASSVLSRVVPGHEHHGVLWWVVVLVVPAVVAMLTNRAARRLLPITALCKLSLVFPDQAPSRMRLALRAGTVRQLEQRIDRARHEGLGGEPTEAAQHLLELVGALNVHDRRTRGHAERVRAYADLLADELRLPDADRDRLHWAALLHDIGKIAVPQHILNKAGAPDDAEWEILKQHPIEGEKLAAPLAGWLGEWAMAIGQHHERWDGKGYPRGLRETEISTAARIVCVADSFEVMTAARSYKRPMSAEAARSELTRCAGLQFDPAVVRAFLSISLGRLRWIMGPLSILAQVPVLPRLREAVQEGILGAARTASVAVTATGLAAAAAVTATTVPAPAPRRAVDAAARRPVRPPSTATMPAETTTTAVLDPVTVPPSPSPGVSTTATAGPSGTAVTVASTAVATTTTVAPASGSAASPTSSSTAAPTTVKPAGATLTTTTTSAGPGPTAPVTSTTLAGPATTTTTAAPCVPLTSKKLTGQDLSGRDLRCMTSLAGYDFSGAQLTGVNLSGLSLDKAKFASADLTSANLSNTNLHETNFTGATLAGADFTGAAWSNTVCPDGHKTTGTAC